MDSYRESRRTRGSGEDARWLNKREEQGNVRVIAGVVQELERGTHKP